MGEHADPVKVGYFPLCIREGAEGVACNTL